MRVVRRAMITARMLLAFALLARFASPAYATDTSWAMLRIGQTAYISGGYDEEHQHVIEVCKSPAELLLADQLQIDHCAFRRSGTRVTVLSFQPGTGPADGEDGPDMQIVHIRAVDGSWTGWVHQIELDPIIPVGTRLRLTTEGNAVPDMYVHRDDPVNKNVELGSPVIVTVLYQHPSDNDCDLQVRVLTGPKAGSVGWTCDTGVVDGTNVSPKFLNWRK